MYERVKMTFVLLTASLLLLSGCQCQFVEHPPSATILRSQPFTMSCAVSDSNPPPVMVWLKDGDERGVDYFDTRITITYNTTSGVSTYSMASVIYVDAGSYQCQGRNMFNELLSSSDSATIVVHGLPVMNALAPLSVIVGSSAGFFCSATSVPLATLSWSFNGQTLISGGQYFISEGFLNIASIQMSNAGFYRCTASNAYGSNSTSVKLTVTAPAVNPTVTITEGSSITIGEGSNTVLHCTVEGESITFIRWSKSGSGEIVNGVSKSSDGATLTLSSIAPSDQGIYTCTATNSGSGTGSDTISVTVIALPQLSVNPSSATILAGQNLTGPTCSFTGGTNGDLLWRAPSGVEVPNVAGQLSLGRPVAVSDDGVYQCVAANLAGTRTTDFTLTVNAPPSFTVRPPSITVSYGQNVFLGCVANGKPTPAITWAKSGGSLQAQSVQLPTGLQLYSVSSSDHDVYTCTATNSVGTNMTTASLTVTIPPHINSISPHEDYYVALGATLSISCNVSTQLGSSIVWYHNGSVISGTGGRVQTLQLSSAIWSLSVSGAMYSDAGIYSCNVTNGFVFDFVSLNAFIGIPASITSGPVDVNGTQNQELFLSCVATGVPQPSLYWYKRDETETNETQLSETDPSYRFEATGLRILNPQRDDTGYYRCVADNRVSSVSQSARVRIEGPPLAVSITPTLLIAGETSRLQCHILYDFPRPVFQWFAANNQALSSRFSIDTNGDLIISPVAPEDQMDVICRVTNSYGTSSVSQFITVHVPPVATLPYPEVVGILDSNLTVTCSATGRPTPTVAMYFPNGEPANDNFFNSETGLLDVASLQATQAGSYICSATNIVGSHNTTLVVHVRGAPPRNPLATPFGPREIRLLWNRPDPQLSSKLLSYTLIYGVKDLSDRLTFNSIGASAFITDLEEYTEYEFEIRGVYSEGVEGLGVNVTETTFEDAPSGSPQNISITSFIELLEVSWLPLDRFDENGIILNYTIHYREAAGNGSNATANFTQVAFVPNSQTDPPFFLNLTGLKGGASYEIKMQAFTSVGGGPNSSVIRAVTQRAFPLVIVLSVTIPVGVILLVALLVLLFFLCYKCIVKIKKARKYAIKKRQREERRKRRRKNKPDVSDPVPEIPPEIDSSRKGKFTLHRADGSVIPSNPKVIQPGDVNRKRKTGAKVVSVKNKRDSTLTNEFDPYDDPDELIEMRTRKQSDKRRRDGFAPRDSKSGIYETPTEPKQKPKEPPPAAAAAAATERKQSIYDDDLPELTVSDRQQPSGGNEDDTVQPVVIKPIHSIQEEEEEEDDLPVETPVAFQPRHTQQDEDEDDLPVETPVAFQPRHSKQRGRREEDSEDSEEEEMAAVKRRRGRRTVEEELDSEEDTESQFTDDDDERNLYAKIPQAHIDKKRSKMLKEKAKMDEKKRKENEKQAAKLKKEKQKQQKKLAQQKKKQMQSQLKRQSLGLDNIMSLRDIDPSSRAGRQLRYSIDSSSANIF